jgi:hypothetical protein
VCVASRAKWEEPSLTLLAHWAVTSYYFASSCCSWSCCSFWSRRLVRVWFPCPSSPWPRARADPHHHLVLRLDLVVLAMMDHSARLAFALPLLHEHHHHLHHHAADDSFWCCSTSCHYSCRPFPETREVAREPDPPWVVLVAAAVDATAWAARNDGACHYHA